MSEIHLGFEAPSGLEVSISPHHLGVTGLTQKAGKTTTLEALAARSKVTAIVFRTGKGEIGFEAATRIGPYFRPHIDWQFVEGLISAHLQEKAKIYRGDIMRVVRGASTLDEVRHNVRVSLAKAREGSFVEKLYTELEQYLNEIIEGLGRVRFESGVTLKYGAVSVMDLEELGPSLQQLVIASTVEYLMERPGRGNVVVLPEARDFIPEDRNTPAKLALERLIRKGAKIGNYLWADSQALTGLDMDVMRNVGTWLFGRQTLDLECRRVAKMAPSRTVRADDVKGLGIGEFFLLEGESVRRVYVQPLWMESDAAFRIARGGPRGEATKTITANRQEAKNVDAKKEREYKETIEHQARTIEALKRQLKQEEASNAPHSRVSPPPPPVIVATPSPSEGGEFEDPPNGRTKADLHVYTEVPSLTIHVREVRLEANEKDLRGRLALMIDDGFMDEQRTVGNIAQEILKRGGSNYATGSQPTLKRELIALADMRFLRRVKNTEFVVMPEAKDHIRKVTDRAS